MVTHTRDLCSAFNPSKVHTHSSEHTHGAVGSHLCYSARGAVGGSVPCSRAPQPWYWGWRECCTFTPPTYNSCLRLEPATFGLWVWPLTIRPRLPHPTFFSVSAGMPGSRYVGVEGWSSKQVAVWLRDQGFREYVDLLCSKHRLDGASLLCLTETDLRSPPLELKVLGDIKRLMLAMRRLQRQHTALTQLGSEVSAFSLIRHSAHFTPCWCVEWLHSSWY